MSRRARRIVAIASAAKNTAAMTVGTGRWHRTASIATRPAPNPSVAARTGCSVTVVIPIAPAIPTKHPSWTAPGGSAVVIHSSASSDADSAAPASVRMRVRWCGGHCRGAGRARKPHVASDTVISTALSATMPATYSPCPVRTAVPISSMHPSNWDATANGHIAATCASRTIWIAAPWSAPSSASPSSTGSGGWSIDRSGVPMAGRIADHYPTMRCEDACDRD